MDKCLSEAQMRRKIVYYNAIIAVLVIWIHTYNIGIYGITPTTPFNGLVYYFEEYLHRYEEFCVPFFFMLSAYLFFVNYELTLDKIKKKYASRFKSLFIPFLIWNFVGFAYFGFMTHFPPIASRMNMEPVDLSVKTYLNCLWTVDYNGSLWYLRNLIILVAISPIIYVLIKNYGKVYLGIITIALTAVYIFLPNTLYLYDRYDRCIYYFIGAYIAVNHKDFIYKKRDKLSLLLLACSLLMNCYFTENEIYAFIRITLTICAVWFLPFDKIWDKEPAWYMKISFFGYCIHTFILEIFEKAWLIIFGYNALGALLDYLLAPVVTVTIITGLAWMIKKVMPPVWRVITGDRG